MTYDGRIGTAAAMLALFVAMVAMSFAYPPDSRFLPLVIGLPGIGLAATQLGIEIRNRRKSQPERTAETRARLRREVVLFGWLAAYTVGILLAGFLVASTAFVYAFLRHDQKESLRLSAGLAAANLAFMYVAFDLLLGVVLFPGFLIELMP